MQCGFPRGSSIQAHVFNKRADFPYTGKIRDDDISLGFTKKSNASILPKLLQIWLDSGVLTHFPEVRESCGL